MRNSNQRMTAILSIIMLSLILSTVAGLAQTSSGGSFQITSSVTAGGGGASHGNGGLSIEGTAGQPAAGGPQSNAPFSHASGFWQTTLAQATPTPQGGAVTLQFSASNYTGDEDCAAAIITVARNGDTSSPVSIDLMTTDGTGRQRADYSIASGTVSFASGEALKTFKVLISKDAYTEGAETINLSLSNPTGGAALGSPNTATLTIVDNLAVPPSTQPIDDAATFVCHQYHDFLARQADTDGAAYWTNQIAQCGGDQSCINSKRIDVSNAFYYEMEFQQTGLYVYRLYREAFGNNQPFANPNPDPQHPGEEKKIPQYLPFMHDRGRVRGGSQLPQMQLDLANAFVQRPEFLTKYPANLDGPNFVDAVLATIKNDIGADLMSQRQALIDLFNAGGRGLVIYRLADDNAQTNPIHNQAFIDTEYNRAFVFTQYTGYLRRDADMPGFLFWLDQVNSGPLRDVHKQHAMVCSFVTSAEYQQRFSAIVTHTNAECGP